MVSVTVGKINFKLRNIWGVWCTFILLPLLQHRQPRETWPFSDGSSLEGAFAAVNEGWGDGGWGGGCNFFP